MKLYAHPFSSYCQKVLIALYENDVPFELRLLADDERIAAEHLALRHPGPVRLIPEDARVALDVRSMECVGRRSC